MKTILLILMITTTVASAQSIEQMGGRVGPRPVYRSAQQVAKERQEQELREAKAAIGSNFIRGVEGKYSDIRNNTNWMTFPRYYERTKFSRMTELGALFDVEKRQTVAWGSGIRDGRTWYEFDHSIIITNLPARKWMAGDELPVMRLYPLTTSSDGLAIYDYGVLPKPMAKTNAASLKKPAQP